MADLARPDPGHKKLTQSDLVQEILTRTRHLILILLNSITTLLTVNLCKNMLDIDNLTFDGFILHHYLELQA